MKFYYKDQWICEHERSWDRNSRVINPLHYENRPQYANEDIDQLTSSFSELEEFYRVLVDRGEPLVTIKKQFLSLYNLYNKKIFTGAIRIAKKRKMYNPSQVSRIAIGLEKQSSEGPRPNFKLKEGIPDIDIPAHSLDHYDDL